MLLYPNSQDGLKRLPYRMQWEDDLRAYLLELDGKKPVVYCGDLNVAHQEMDLKNPKTNRQNPGFSDEERAKMTRLLESGFADTFRTLHPEEITYSWWSYRFHAREKNAGWRIDYFIVSRRLLPSARRSTAATTAPWSCSWTSPPGRRKCRSASRLSMQAKNKQDFLQKSAAKW